METLPHTGIFFHHLSTSLIGDTEDSVDDVDDAVDGSDVLLQDGGVDAPSRCRHPLLARPVVEPDPVVGQRGGS